MSQGEWINYAQDYYKIATSKEGVYHLSYTTLSASGINMNLLDPRDIRVYHRGEEVAVFVEGQGDGKFDANDYLELVGQKNDGTIDSHPDKYCGVAHEEAGY